MKEFTKTFNIDIYHYLCFVEKVYSLYCLRIKIYIAIDMCIYDNTFSTNNKQEIINAFNDIDNNFAKNHIKKITNQLKFTEYAKLHPV